MEKKQLEAEPAQSKKEDAPQGSKDVSNTSVTASLLQNVMKSIVWLGASIGGIIAILGALGFIVILSNESMLGVTIGLRDPMEYIIMGGVFLNETGAYSTRYTKFNSEIVLSTLFLIVLILSYSRLGMLNKYFIILRDIAIVGSIIILQLSASHMDLTRVPGGFLTHSIPGNEITALMIQGDYEALGKLYGSSAAAVLIASTAIIYCIWKSFIDRKDIRRTKFVDKSRALLKAVALLLALNALLTLTFGYGKIMNENHYPKIIDYGIQKDSDPFLNVSREKDLLLLYEDSKEVIIYDRANLQILYLRRDVVNYIRIGGYSNIFRGRHLEYTQRLD